MAELGLEGSPRVIDAEPSLEDVFVNLSRAEASKSNWLHALVLWTMGIVAFALAAMKFRKRLS